MKDLEKKGFWTSTLPEIVEEVYGMEMEGMKASLLAVVAKGMVDGKPWGPFKEVGQNHPQFLGDIMDTYSEAVQASVPVLPMGVPHRAGMYFGCPGSDCTKNTWYSFCPCNPAVGKPMVCCKYKAKFIVPAKKD